MPDEKIKKLKKLLNFAEEPGLAVIDELQEANETLKSIEKKQPVFPEIPPFPKIPPFPETDLTETNAELSKLAESITALAKNPLDYIEKKAVVELGKKVDLLLEKAIKEQENSLNFLRDKVRELKNGRDGIQGEKGEKGEQGVAGKDGGSDTNIQVRDKLETLEEGEKLKIEAIENLRKELDELKKLSSQTRVVGGGTSQLGVSMALSNLIAVETPTGLINGVNLAYTTTHNITKVLSFAINGMTIHSTEYTISGNTITFITALPAELSGTSFEITYF